MPYKTSSERLDEHHARLFREAYWNPEAVAERRRLDREDAADLAQRSECPDCLAGYGQPCVGLVSSVHYGRQVDYVRRGSWVAR